MKGHEVINHIVRDEMPDFEKVRSNCHRQASYASRNTAEFKRFVPVAAALVMLFAISTTVFAAVWGFDWFVQRFNPRFADIVKPIMLHSEDEGIRITLLGAQTSGYMAVIYLSVSDVTGENRLTDSNLVLVDFCLEGIDLHIRELRFNRLYFDESTNTFYQEIIITADRAFIDPLRFSIDTIFANYDMRRDEGIQGYWPFSAYTGDNAQQIVTVTEAVQLDNYHITEHLTLTPFGLLVMGNLSEPESWHCYDTPGLRVIWSHIDVYLETTSGLMTINESYGEGYSDGQSYFYMNWHTESPIDVNEVTAIIIDGLRIPMP